MQVCVKSLCTFKIFKDICFLSEVSTVTSLLISINFFYIAVKTKTANTSERIFKFCLESNKGIHVLTYLWFTLLPSILYIGIVTEMFNGFPFYIWLLIILELHHSTINTGAAAWQNKDSFRCVQISYILEFSNRIIKRRFFK